MASQISSRKLDLALTGAVIIIFAAFIVAIVWAAVVHGLY